jgi:uncharacterized protein (TIGR03435 family)
VRAVAANLLNERFQLKLRNEKREIPFYALVVDRKGLRMKESGAAPADGQPHLGRGNVIVVDSADGDRARTKIDRSSEEIVGRLRFG